MSFREKLHYLLLGASSITRMAPASGVVRGQNELAVAAEKKYQRLMNDAERRIRE